MLKLFNTMLVIVTAAILTVGCQSTHHEPQNAIIDKSHTESAPLDYSEQIVGKYWKLIELEGRPVTMTEDQQREIHIKLSAEQSRVSGFAGCNNFFGTYAFEKGMKIKFTELATTMMACPDLEVNEQAFLEVLNLTNNYTLYKDTLQLNIGKRAPLAVFKAVYFE